jgi:hypothetical protein
MSLPPSLDQILALVGGLDDSHGDDTSARRFRKFLETNVTKPSQVRDYISECLTSKGERKMQYNRALQDLVNHVGRLLGFVVEFGRYQGAIHQIGFDGHWVSQSAKEAFHVVVEVKSTENFLIKTDTLLDYINKMITEGKIPGDAQWIGLYVVGLPDPDNNQLEKSIVFEKRGDKLRIISVDYLLSLAELMSQYEVTHDDILAVLRPSSPIIDPVVDLMRRLVVGSEVIEKIPPESRSQTEPSTTETATNVSYWITSVRGDGERTAEGVIRDLVGKQQKYAFGENNPGRSKLKGGDWICFYASGNGVVAYAKAKSSAEMKPEVVSGYPWVFDLESVTLLLDKPVIIDADLRSRLEVFQKRENPNAPWAWFVQATRKVTQKDFDQLTGRLGPQ